MTDQTLSIESHQQEQDAQDMATAREVLLLIQPDFAELTADEQAREIAEFVLQRRAEWRASPELREWVNAGAN